MEDNKTYFDFAEEIKSLQTYLEDIPGILAKTAASIQGVTPATKSVAEKFEKPEIAKHKINRAKARKAKRKRGGKR